MRRWVDVRRWLGAAALAVVACACQPTNQPGAPEAPDARTDASSAYDPATGTIVLFGGAKRSGVLDDTWTWDGAVWRRQHPATSPPARELAYMAYDPATSRVILFGGTRCAPPSPTQPTGCDYQEAAVSLRDTWSWDGRDWSQVQTTRAPEVRHFTGDNGAMDADLAHGDLVLVTWPTGSEASQIETWRFHSGDWQQLAPAHPVAPREFTGPAYDAVSKRLVLQQIGFVNVTYWWDGSDWHTFDVTVMTPHTYGRLLSAGQHGLLLIDFSNMARWNGSSWSKLTPLPATFRGPALQVRVGWTASYHEPTQRLILFGGRDNAGGPDLLGDTVGWDGASWKALVPQPPISLPAVLPRARHSSRCGVLAAARSPKTTPPVRSSRWSSANHRRDHATSMSPSQRP